MSPRNACTTSSRSTFTDDLPVPALPLDRESPDKLHIFPFVSILIGWISQAVVHTRTIHHVNSTIRPGAVKVPTHPVCYTWPCPVKERIQTRGSITNRQCPLSSCRRSRMSPIEWRPILCSFSGEKDAERPVGVSRFGRISSSLLAERSTDNGYTVFCIDMKETCATPKHGRTGSTRKSWRNVPCTRASSSRTSRRMPQRSC